MFNPLVGGKLETEPFSIIFCTFGYSFHFLEDDYNETQRTKGNDDEKNNTKCSPEAVGVHEAEKEKISQQNKKEAVVM